MSTFEEFATDHEPAQTPWGGGRIQLDLLSGPDAARATITLYDFEGGSVTHPVPLEPSTLIRAYDLRFDWGRRNAATLQLALAINLELWPWREALEHAKDFRDRVLARIPRAEHVRVLVHLRTYEFEIVADEPAAVEGTSTE